MFTEGRGWGKIFQVYVGIEVFIWMPALYATCYTLQPSARFMQTSCGKEAVDRVASCLQHYTPSYHGKLVSLSSKIYGAYTVDPHSSGLGQAHGTRHCPGSPDL